MFKILASSAGVGMVPPPLIEDLVEAQGKGAALLVQRVAKPSGE
jgi:hypothetical protein